MLYWISERLWFCLSYEAIGSACGLYTPPALNTFSWQKDFSCFYEFTRFLKIPREATFKAKAFGKERVCCPHGYDPHQLIIPFWYRCCVTVISVIMIDVTYEMHHMPERYRCPGSLTLTGVLNLDKRCNVIRSEHQTRASDQSIRSEHQIRASDQNIRSEQQIIASDQNIRSEWAFRLNNPKVLRCSNSTN